MAQNDGTKTFELDVPLSELVELGSINGLNDLLEERMGGNGITHIPTGIDYRVIGHTDGDDTTEGFITILATYTPDYIDADEEDDEDWSTE